MSDVVVDLRDVSLRRGGQQVLSGARLRVDRSAIVALMGASGSGKTTILRTVAGLEPFDQGSIVVDGVTLERGTPSPGAMRALRRKVGMVFQFHCLFEHLSAIHNVCLALVHVMGLRQADAEARARDLLRALGIERRAHALPRELSGGEAQRVAIARALATDPPVLLMDEPTASLDPARRTELTALLRSLVGRRRTLIVATHDEDFARSVATDVRCVHAGQILGQE